MLCSERLKKTVSDLTGLSAAELEDYSLIIENAAQAVKNMLSSPDCEKGVMLAAAKAAYEISLYRYGDGVTSFKAGDVSFSMSGEAVKNAERAYNNALSDCRDIIKDSGFVFRAV